MDGEMLRQRRKELNMTQGELATALNVYQATISQWEQCRRNIRHGRVLELALMALAAGMRVEDGNNLQPGDDPDGRHGRGIDGDRTD